ncbi:hypothetical protein [Flavobacterium sp. 3HN19-14]|uniref:hypothetical protein n=1 Tax=Flavobacterium sp. 3HN19-14 TaxID=3448133 RepID=UPI003EDEF2A6
MKTLMTTAAFMLTMLANAQQSNQREQVANQIATKDINNAGWTTAGERERIIRDAKIESMHEAPERPEHESHEKSDHEAPEKPEHDRPDHEPGGNR